MVKKWTTKISKIAANKCSKIQNRNQVVAVRLKKHLQINRVKLFLLQQFNKARLSPLQLPKSKRKKLSNDPRRVSPASNSHFRSYTQLLRHVGYIYRISLSRNSETIFSLLSSILNFSPFTVWPLKNHSVSDESSV